MNLFTLFREDNAKAQAVEYLQDKNILHKQRVCRNGHNMIFNLGRDKNDKWRCRKGKCYRNHSSVGLKSGTWMEGSKLALETVVWFIYCWCRQYTSTKFCDNEFLMSTSTSTDWKNRMREVCAKSLLQNPMVIGGEGMTVEIHQSCFSCNRHRGKEAQQQWVFGGVCRETSECFLWAVAEPSAETLLEAVSGGVRPGSTIVSDLFECYGGSHLLPPHYTLLNIKKSNSIFVNPSTGDAVEPLWSIYKRRNKKSRRPEAQHRGQDSYLCEFLWRERHGNVDLVDQLYKDIASIYPLKDVME